MTHPLPLENRTIEAERSIPDTFVCAIHGYGTRISMLTNTPRSLDKSLLNVHLSSFCHQCQRPLATPGTDSREQADNATMNGPELPS